MSDCLVLDKNWRPVGFCSWENAIKLSWEGAATIIREDESGRQLHSPSITIGFPRVIVVRSAWKRRKKMSLPCSRRNLLIRDHARCQYCGKTVSVDDYTIDHVIPLCQGGPKNGWSNQVVACISCNKEKGGMTPEEVGMRLLYSPAEPKPTDPRFDFKLHAKKLRPEWKDWANQLNWDGD